MSAKKQANGTAEAQVKGTAEAQANGTAEAQVEGMVTIRRRFAKGGVLLSQDGHHEVIVTRQLPVGVRPASVTASCEMKLNLGNYQMAEVSAMVTVPCVTEEIEEALEFAYKIAGDHVENLVKQIKGDATPQPVAPSPAAGAPVPWEVPGAQAAAPQPASSVQPVPIQPAYPPPNGMPMPAA
jgi:hypothetical protein